MLKNQSKQPLITGTITHTQNVSVSMFVHALAYVIVHADTQTYMVIKTWYLIKYSPQPVACRCSGSAGAVTVHSADVELGTEANIKHMPTDRRHTPRLEKITNKSNNSAENKERNVCYLEGEVQRRHMLNHGTNTVSYRVEDNGTND